MPLADKAELDEIRARVPLGALIGRRVPLKKRGGEQLGLCPFHAEKTPSFTVVERKGFFHCFGCGAHGDHFAFVMRLEGVDFAGAVARLRGEAGLDELRRDPDQVARDRVRLARQQAELARREAERERWRAESALSIWRRARPAGGTLVEAYLRSRGIEPAAIGGVPPSLRFDPEATHPDTGEILPAMVAGVQGARDRVVAIHRTFLRADGGGKANVEPAKMMLGPCWRGGVRFAPAGPVLAIGEGIETCLSVLQALRRTGDMTPVWAALSLGNIAGGGDGETHRRVRHPEKPDRWLPSAWPDLARPGLLPPEGTREVILLADADGDRATTEALLARAARRLQQRNLRVRIARPPGGMDFNDWERQLQGAERARAAAALEA
jgi:DNA primase